MRSIFNTLGEPTAMLAMSIGALFIALTFGGGTTTYGLGDSIAEAFCAAVVMIAAASLWRTKPNGLTKGAFVIIGFLLAIPALQLVPLPPSIWTSLPGRDVIVAGFHIANIEPLWAPITLSPSGTRQSLFSLIPALSVFLTTIQLTRSQKRFLLACFLAYAVFSVAIGLIQARQGAESTFRLYYQAEDVVGLFANRNHFAAFMYVSLLLSISWQLSMFIEFNNENKNITRVRFIMIKLLLISLVIGCIIIGIFSAQSRAGFIISMFAIIVGFASSAFYAGNKISGNIIASTMVGLGAVLLLCTDLFMYQILQRLENGLSDSTREHVLSAVEMLIFKHFPIGSGFGTFVPIYSSYESVSTSLQARVNRAHNDYFEWILEGGIPALLLMAACGVWLLCLNFRAWFRPQPMSLLDASLLRSCSSVPLLLLAHSSFDYPLRTVALMSVFALCCGICLEYEPASLRAPSSVPRTRSRA